MFRVNIRIFFSLLLSAVLHQSTQNLKVSLEGEPNTKQGMGVIIYTERNNASVCGNNFDKTMASLFCNGKSYSNFYTAVYKGRDVVEMSCKDGAATINDCQVTDTNCTDDLIVFVCCDIDTDERSNHVYVTPCKFAGSDIPSRRCYTDYRSPTYEDLLKTEFPIITDAKKMWTASFMHEIKEGNWTFNDTSKQNSTETCMNHCLNYKLRRNESLGFVGMKNTSCYCFIHRSNNETQSTNSDNANMKLYAVGSKIKTNQTQYFIATDKNGTLSVEDSNMALQVLCIDIPDGANEDTDSRKSPPFPTTNSTPPSDKNIDMDSGKRHTMSIVVGVVVIVAVVVALFGVLWCYMRRGFRKSNMNAEQQAPNFVPNRTYAAGRYLETAEEENETYDLPDERLMDETPPQLPARPGEDILVMVDYTTPSDVIPGTRTSESPHPETDYMTTYDDCIKTCLHTGESATINANCTVGYEKTYEPKRDNSIHKKVENSCCYDIDTNKVELEGSDFIHPLTGYDANIVNSKICESSVSDGFEVCTPYEESGLPPKLHLPTVSHGSKTCAKCDDRSSDSDDSMELLLCRDPSHRETDTGYDSPIASTQSFKDTNLDAPEDVVNSNDGDSEYEDTSVIDGNFKLKTTPHVDPVFKEHICLHNIPDAMLNKLGIRIVSETCEYVSYNNWARRAPSHSCIDRSHSQNENRSSTNIEYWRRNSDASVYISEYASSRIAPFHTNSEHYRTQQKAAETADNEYDKLRNVNHCFSGFPKHAGDNIYSHIAFKGIRNGFVDRKMQVQRSSSF